MPKDLRLLLFVVTFIFSSFLYASPEVSSDLIPEELRGVGIDQSVLGTYVDLNTEFVDEEGTAGPLSQFFLNDKPVILSVVYYNCPGLCSLHMNGAAAVFEEMKFRAGQDFNWLLITMDSSEGPDLALKKKLSYMNQFNVPGAGEGWKFLTTTDENTKKITKELGFSYKWDEKTKQFAHSAAFYVLSPDGLISQIIPGVGFEAQTVRLALVQAAKGKIGGVVDQLLLFCFRFDPEQNKFTLYAFNLMRAAAALTVVALGIILVPLWRKEKNKVGGL